MWPERQSGTHTYTAFHHLLTDPVYAGPYVFGQELCGFLVAL
jgi:hypothetical protein